MRILDESRQAVERLRAQEARRSPDEKALALVARIAAAGTAIALAFLAGEVLPAGR
jgi:hypothetical protein